MSAEADAAHACEGPGCRSAALHEAWVTHNGDYYFGPLFWDALVERFNDVRALIESRSSGSIDTETLARAIEDADYGDMYVNWTSDVLDVAAAIVREYAKLQGETP